MKPVLAFIVTFVVATAASTGAKVMTTKPAQHAKANSTAMDSTAARDSTHTDSSTAKPAAPVTPPIDTTPRAPVVPVAAGDSSKRTTIDPKSASTPVAPAVKPSADTASERRLSKVFTSMEPKQAAKVLEHMTDNDVHVILGYVGPRQAASIMAELPPERVAKLSKLAMTAGRGGTR